MSNVRQFHAAGDIHAALADADWHDGAMAVLTYPTAPPVAYFSYDNPKFGGTRATVGDAVTKDDAGNFIVERI
jgi:hypothetical protein